MNRKISSAIEKVWSGLAQSNFLIEKASMPTSGMFVRNLYDTLKMRKADFIFLPVVVNMEEVKKETFFSSIIGQLYDLVKAEHPGFEFILKEALNITDIVDFVYYMKRFEEEFLKKDISIEQPLRIILILYNTDVLDQFGQHFKENLNDILKENIFRAVIVAEKISRRWNSDAPHWLSPFQNIMLL